MILIFMVLDPFGNIPLFSSVLNTVPAEKRQRVVIRELLIALMILVVFLFSGPFFMKAMQISSDSLRVAGGVILLMIAIKMVFGETEQMFKGNPDGEPFIVPLAVPCIAGPSAAATVLILVGKEPSRWPEWLLALCVAWLANSLVLVLATRFAAMIGKRVLIAVERLMGLVLAAVSAEMLLQGLHMVLEN